MSRIGLAFSCFFSILFKGKLPAGAALLAPDDNEWRPTPPPVLVPAPVPAPAPPATTTVAPAAPPRDGAEGAPSGRTEGALVLLGLLQREGRLVDFLRESL